MIETLIGAILLPFAVFAVLVTGALGIAVVKAIFKKK